MKGQRARTAPIRAQRLPNGELDVDQPNVNGWEMSWNPDDDRWYVEIPNTNGAEAVATFADRKNAMTWARGHSVADYQPAEV